MKKYLYGLAIVGTIFLGSMTLGAGANKTGTVTVDTKIDSAVFNQANEEVQSIDVNFCETVDKFKEMTVRPGQEEDICLEAKNSANKDILLSLYFVDGGFTNDRLKNRACYGNEKQTDFGQYVTGVETSFVIPAGSSIVKHAKLKYPEGSKGLFHGCIVYYTKGVQTGGPIDFNILIRKAKFIDVNVKQPFWKEYRRIILIVAGVLVIGGIGKTKFSHKKK